MSYLTDINNKTSQQLAQYAKLQVQEQRLLMVLSLIGEGVEKDMFKPLLAHIDKQEIAINKGLSLACAFNNAFQKKARPQGLITERYGSISLSIYIANTITKQAIDEHIYDPLLEAVNNCLAALYGRYRAHSGYRNINPSPVDRKRQLRHAYFTNDFQQCEDLLTFNKNPQVIDKDDNGLVSLIFYPFDQNTFTALPESLKYQSFATLFLQLRRSMQDNRELLALLNELNAQGLVQGNLRYLLAENCLQDNQLTLVGDLLNAQDNSAYALSLRAWFSFLQGQDKQAIDLYLAALVAKNKISRRKYQCLGGLPGLYCLLAMLKIAHNSDVSYYRLLQTELDNYVKGSEPEKSEYRCYAIIRDLALVLTDPSEKLYIRDFSNSGYYSDEFYKYLEVLFTLLAGYWCEIPVKAKNLQILLDFCQKIQNKGLNLFHASSLTLLTALADEAFIAQNPDFFSTKNQSFTADQNPLAINLLTLVQKKQGWDLALDQLLAIDAPDTNSVLLPAATDMRLIWQVDVDQYPYPVSAREQKLGKRGWSKGRKISLKQLYHELSNFHYLSEQDRQICQQITESEDQRWGRRSYEYYELSGFAALNACIGIDNLYVSEDLNQAIEIVAAEAELILKEDAKGFHLQLNQLPDDIAKLEAYCELKLVTKQRYSLTNFDEKALKIAMIIGPKGLKIPIEAKQKVLLSIRAIAPLLTIKSNMADLDTGIAQTPANTSLYINIQPNGAGLTMECHHQPLGEFGPHVLPCVGNDLVFAEIEGKRLGTTRNLKLEKQQQKLLHKSCPMFKYMVDHLLVLDDLSDALTTLEQLELLQQGGKLDLELQWPKGKSINLIGNQGSDSLQLSMKKQQDWFALDGSLTVSADQVLELKTLLQLVDQAQGKFISLGEGQFLSLTEQLKRQLSELARTTEQGKFHALAAPTVDSILQDMSLKPSSVWQSQLKKIKQAYKLEPKLPTTLQAQLRDYQLEGYDWASRLAHWGAGACLADDMGLGKTLQALALILARADKGPSLVLAPTSVCFNWHEEAAKFAPTLKVKNLGLVAQGQRSQIIDKAGEYDLIICSYGLLQHQTQLLSPVNWQTLVADEAQAIKNPLSKRAKAAMSLSAKFKMITTGTPIENNLSELWSLFNFINPGLLGSKEAFDKRFARKIETNDSKAPEDKIKAKEALRKLIGPFMLRRLKSDVLTELPSRTEINLSIKQSQDEIAFYEALRQRAVENITQSQQKPGQQRIKILAEIMKLRRACCHPSLVMPESQLGSAKFNAFVELIDELLSGKHKVLVFSQFVGHLSILREHLMARGISHQYLDGSTSAPKRKKAVNAFQSGEGDVFLISLKAGGSGLNLTAADYVIHMDPWWNPAVEDQASDRAHRMGQTRPVTIYRLITKNTIEDKIVGLHQQKRDLANSLLTGSESSGKLSLQDMMLLLQDESSQDEN